MCRWCYSRKRSLVLFGNQTCTAAAVNNEGSCAQYGSKVDITTENWDYLSYYCRPTVSWSPQCVLEEESTVHSTLSTIFCILDCYSSIAPVACVALRRVGHFPSTVVTYLQIYHVESFFNPMEKGSEAFCVAKLNRCHDCGMWNVTREHPCRESSSVRMRTTNALNV